MDFFLRHDIYCNVAHFVLYIFLRCVVHPFFLFFCSTLLCTYFWWDKHFEKHRLNLGFTQT